MAERTFTGFGNHITGLLDNPMFNIGAGLLASSGPSLQPVGFGQALAGGMEFATKRQAQQMQMDAARMKIAQEQERAKAMTQLQGLMAPGTTPGPIRAPTPAAISTPEGMSQAQGLLMQVAPEAMAQGLLAQQFKTQEPPRVSTDYNTFKQLNPELAEGTPAFREAFRAFTTESDPTGDLMEQAQLQILTNELALAREARTDAQETRSQERATTTRSVIQDVRHLQEMADLNQRLTGTALESGLPMPELRRAWTGGVQALTALTGGDTGKAAALKADFDRFDKLSTDFVVGSLDRLQGTGAIGETKFEALISSNASLGASPEANNLIIADNLEALLEGAEIEGINIPNADKIPTLIQSLRSSRSNAPLAQMPTMPGTTPAPVPGAAPDVQALQSEIQQLEAQLKALEGGR